jgi:hypothetical protein
MILLLLLILMAVIQSCSTALINSGTIPDNSIDLIFTDPLYYEKDLYLYEYLAKLSAMC